MNKIELTNLSQEIISQIGLLNKVKEESRESILNYLGKFGSEIDELINKFYMINSQIADNGGAPVLKQLIMKLYENSPLTIEFAENTTCLMLKDEDNNLINYQFINKYEYLDMLLEKGMENIIQEYANRNHVKNYTWGGLV